MQDNFVPPPGYASGQYAPAVRGELEEVDRYDFSWLNNTYEGFIPAEVAEPPATEADLDWLFGSTDNTVAQLGLEGDGAEFDCGLFHFVNEPAQPQSQAQQHAGGESEQQPESSTEQPRHGFEEKAHRKGVRVFTDEQLDIIQGMIEKDPTTKPRVIHRRLKEIDPSMTLSIRQVNGSVKDARRQKEKREAGMYNPSPNGGEDADFE